MRSPHRIAIALTSAAAIAVAVAVGAGGATTSRTAWSRLSGPTQPGVQLGLARTPDGVLHAIWNRGTSPTSIFETRFSPAGAASGTSTVATGWDGNGGLALLVMPDKTLRLFAAGGTHPGSSAYGINTFTAPSGGRTWTLQDGTFWGGAVANASGVIGATLTKDGQAVTSWRGYAAEGIPPTVQNAYEGGMTASVLATDGASGDVVLSGATNAGQGGIYIQRVLPSTGPHVVLQLPSGENDWYSSVSGRLGAPGVYLAYADTKAVRLYRYGGGSKTLASGPFTSAAACAGPDERLWIAWGNQSGDVFVTRSNRAAAAFEPVQRVKLAQGANGLTFMQCEGSAGPDDLFAYVPGGATAGFWHTHVLAQLSLAARGRKAASTISVRDAGDPVAGARIAVGGRHLTTDAHGLASAKLPAGSYTATATAPGYAPASAHFTVR
jgi:carboxypeptidase family protein